MLDDQKNRKSLNFLPIFSDVVAGRFADPESAMSPYEGIQGWDFDEMNDKIEEQMDELDDKIKGRMEELEAAMEKMEGGLEGQDR